MQIKDEESYGNMLYYTMDGKHTSFVQIKIVLDEDVVDTAMESAFERSCKRFPYFMTTLKKEGNCLITVPNSKIPVVHHDNLDYVIDYSENDGFLFRFSTNKNIIIFSFFHGLTDGVGIFCFLRVILTEYYKNLGEEVVLAQDFIDINSLPDEEEYAEPLTRVPDNCLLEEESNNPFFIMPLKKQKNYKVYSFSVSQKKMMEYASKNGGSPNSISQIVIAKTVQNLYPEAADIGIAVSVAINAKPFLQLDKSLKPCIALSVFNFNKENLALGEKELNVQVRKNIIADTNEEKLFPFLAGMKKLFRILDLMDDVKTKQLMCQRATTVPKATVAESYVGIVPFGSMEKHIKGIYSFCETPLPLVEINYINGRFFYSISAENDISDFANKLMENFNALGFECSEVECQELKTGKRDCKFPKAGLNLTTLKMIKAVNKYKKKL